MWTWIVVVVALVVAVCAWVALHPTEAGDRAKLDRGFSTSERHLIDTVSISQEELSTATCVDGAKCWIAVDGVVYDMSGFPKWVTGLHHGVRAGQDDTDAFVKSGHGRAYLQRMPVVGAYKP